MFKRIDHVEIVTRDIAKTVDFYTQVLGFAVKQRQPGRQGGPFQEIVYLTLGNTMLEVIVMPDAALADERPASVAYRMMALEVENMEKAIELLQGKGVEISRPPMDMGHAKRGEIKDPNGLSIELRWWANLDLPQDNHSWRKDMDMTEAIRNRRSIKGFTQDVVSRETLEGLIDLARLSPSGANKNAWRFVVIQNADTLQRLSETHRNCGWLKEAPVGIAVVIDPTATRYWLEDCSVAAITIWLAATGQGLGAAWAAMYQSDNAEETARRQKQVKETLAIPDNLMVPMVLAVGYPASQPVAKNRPQLNEVVCWERYIPQS